MAEDVDMDNSGGDTVLGVAAAPAISADPVAAAASAVSPAPAVAKKRREKRRCRTCGLAVVDWRQYHVIPHRPAIEGERHSIRFLQNGAWRYCTVPESLRQPDFPCPEGKELPRRRNK